MSLAGYICATCHAYHQIINGNDPCPHQETVEAINLCHSEFFEQEAVHIPGRPVFRTRGQRDRYMKQHGLVQFGKSDVQSMKRNLERSGGRLPAKHDMKAWWRKEARKYGDLVNRPAFQSR